MTSIRARRLITGTGGVWLRVPTYLPIYLRLRIARRELTPNCESRCGPDAIDAEVISRAIDTVCIYQAATQSIRFFRNLLSLFLSLSLSPQRAAMPTVRRNIKR